MNARIRRLFTRGVKTPAPVRNPRPPRRAALRLDPLEDRTNPSNYTVTSTADSGTGTLRDAVTQAQANAGPDTIDFNLPAGAQTIGLLSALPTITQDLTVTNTTGAANLTITRGGGATGSFSFFTIGSGATAVGFAGLTMSGGQSTGGGAIYNGTTAAVGITDCVLANNNSTGNGGAVYFATNANLTVLNSTVTGNTAAAKGGGLYFFFSGGLLVSNSTISGNTANSTSTTYSGGGISFYGTVSSFGFRVQNSTVHGNTAAGTGGGIALVTFSGTAIVQNSTVTGNTAGGNGGGGISLTSGSGTISLDSTVVALNNVTGTAPATSKDVLKSAGTLTASTSFVGVADLLGLSAPNITGTAASPANPMLGPLQNNGGTTLTRAPLTGSPLLNAGANTAGLSFDQRGTGFARVLAGTPDIGSVEGISTIPTATANLTNVTSAGGTSYTFSVTYNATSPALMNYSTLGTGDVTVSGPNGFSATPTFVGAAPASNSASITATYTFAPPGGAWSASGNGTYTVSMAANQVSDTAPVAVPAGAIGTFTVATGFLVTTTADSGTGSLRDAITQADASATNDTITFNLPAGPQTINLLTALPQISNGDLTITNATGAANLTVRRSTSAGSSFGVFSISASSPNVTFDGITISGGNAGLGAGITASTQNLTVRNSVITGNTGGVGGAIYVPYGSTGLVTIQNTTITSNTGGTGGIYFYGNGNLRVQNSTISNNTGTNPAVYHGGGIIFFGDVGASGFTVENSTITGNTTASTAGGGGINFDYAYGAATIRNSTITGNSAPTGASGGGGVGVTSGALTLTIQSTIIAENTGPSTGPDLRVANGSATGTNCLIGVVPPANFSGTGNLTGTTAAPLSPQLGPLQNNGGATFTRVPLPGSPVLNVGSNPASLANDQRGFGFLRSYGSGVDIGAAEFQPPVVFVNQAATQADPTNAGPILFTVTFSEPVTGFDNSDVSLAGSTAGGPLVAAVSGSGTTYTISVTGMSSSGTVTAAVAAGAATGTVTGLASQASVSLDNVVTYDIIRPTVTINQASGQVDPTGASPVQFTVAFSEPVAGFTGSKVSFAGSTVGGTLVASVTGTGPVYTVNVTGMTGLGTVVASIPVNAVTDLAGNLSFASTSTDNSVTFDGIPPAVTINQATGQADPTNTGPILFTVVFSEPVTGFTASDVSFAGSTVGGTLVASVSGTGPTYAVSVSGMNGTGTVVASIPAGAANDLAGNASLASTSTDRTVTFDNVRPTVTVNQAAGQADPTNTGPVLFTVVFSEPVVGFTGGKVSFAGSTVGGTLSASVSGTGPTYTVAVTGMNGTGTVMLSVPASSVNDPAGNANVASTSTDNTVLFDNVPPTVTINQAATQLDPTHGTPIAFTVVFSEPVTGFTASDVSLAGSTVPGILSAAVSGSGANYTVTVTGMVGLGTVVASIPVGAALDQAANPSTASTSTDNVVTFDEVPPTVTIDQAVGQPDPANGPIQFTVVFNEPVVPFAGGKVSFAGSTVGGTLVASVAGSGTTYTVTVTGMDGTGNVVASLPAGATTDIAGNPSRPSTSTDHTVAFDNIRPSVTINRAFGQPSLTAASPVLFTVAFSEPVTGFTASDVSFSGSTVGGTLSAAVSGSGRDYTVSVSGMTGNGTVVATVPAGGARDAAGNTNVVSTSTDNTVTFDDQIAAVTIDQAAGQADPTNAGPVLFDVVFSSPVTGFDGSDVSLAGSTVGGTLSALVTGSGANYTVSVSGMTGTGTVVASIPAGAARNVNDHPSLASTSTDDVVTFDAVAPTVTVGRAAGQPAATNGSSAQFAVTFSEPVTGFDATDVDLTGTTAGGTLMASVSGSGASYTVTVGGVTSAGTVVVSVPAGAAADAAGNPSRASTGSNNTVTFDTTPPTVTINQASGQADPTNAGPVRFAVHFSEPVTGFTGSDVSFAGSTVGGTLSATVSGSGADYVVSVTGMSGSGNVVAGLPAGAVTDLAGNPSAASTSSDNTVAFNGAPPTVTINQAAGQADPANAGPIAFTVVFSTPVTGFDASDVSFAGSTAGGVLSASVSGSGAAYAVSVTGMTSPGTVVASILAGAAFDGAGNASGASTSTDHTVAFDGTAPTVTINQAAGQPDLTGAGPVLFTVVFSEPVTGFDGSDVSFAGSTVGGTPVATVSGSGANYTVSVTGMAGVGTLVASIPAGAAADAAGNVSGASTSTDHTVRFDGVVPTVTIDQATGQADPAGGDPVVFTVVFSEPVTGFDASGVSLAGSTGASGLSAAVSGSGTTYTVTVTGTSGAGVVIASIPAGVAFDAAGNANAASTSTDHTVRIDPALADATPPTVTVNQAVGQADPTSGGPILFTVTFSEPVTGFDASDVSLAGSTAGGALVPTVSGGGAGYTIAVTGMTSPGAVTVSFPAGAAADAGGNASLAPTLGDARVTYAGGLVAVGSGPGGPSRVDLYDGAGKLRNSIFPFDPSFSGGVQVATADVTGDGVPDVVVGTGPGVATLVKVYDGSTGRELLAYQPFEPSFVGGVFVAAGDLTGDGVGEVVITPNQGGGPRVLVLRGGSFSLAANFFGIADPDFRGGARGAVGDINGDGFADLAVAAGFEGGPRVSVYDGKTVTTGSPANLFGDLFIFDGADAMSLRNGAFVAIGDLDGDGLGDLIGGGGPGGGPRVFALSGADLLRLPANRARVLANFFAGPDTNRGGVQLAAKDMDGDGRADIVTGTGPGDGTRVTAYAGSSLPGSPQPLYGFDAFGGVTSGVFVG